MRRNKSCLFDTFLIIDWSAANAPKRGKDSIWIGETRRGKKAVRTKAPINPATRSEAVDLLTTVFEKELAAGRRVFAGFDFPFGYPAGAADKITGTARWDALWRTLADEVEDDDRNRSNRYALAERWNRKKFRDHHFWGHPHQHAYKHLAPKKPFSAAFKALEYRLVERWRPPAKSVWQLAYNGAVGSQAMLGMARLQELRQRFRGQCAVWPFETKWANKLDAPIMIAEVYPTMFEPKFQLGDVKDAAQVRTVANAYAALDKLGAFEKLLSMPAGLGATDNRKVLSEEGWIVGAGHESNA